MGSTTKWSQLDRGTQVPTQRKTHHITSIVPFALVPQGCKFQTICLEGLQKATDALRYYHREDEDREYQ